MKELKFHFGAHQINTLTLDRESARTEEQNQRLLDVLFLDSDVWQAILISQTVNQVYILRDGYPFDNKTLERHIANGGELIEIARSDSFGGAVLECLAASTVVIVLPYGGTALSGGTAVGLVNIDTPSE